MLDDQHTIPTVALLLDTELLFKFHGNGNRNPKGRNLLPNEFENKYFEQICLDLG